MSCQPGDTDPSFPCIQQSAVWQGKNSSTCTSPGEMLHIPSARSEQQFHCRITWNKSLIKSVLEARPPPASEPLMEHGTNCSHFLPWLSPVSQAGRAPGLGFLEMDWTAHRTQKRLGCEQVTQWQCSPVLPVRSLHFREAELYPPAPAGRNRLCSSSHAMPALQTAHRNKHIFTLQWSTVQYLVLFLLMDNLNV